VDVVVFTIRVLLAGVFAIAGVAKLTDRPGAAKAMADFGVPVSVAGLLAVFLSLSEILIAISLLVGPLAFFGAIGALTLLTIFTIAVIINLMRGRKPDCHCFGQLHSSPIGWKTILRNGVLAVMAGFLIFRKGTVAALGIQDIFVYLGNTPIVVGSLAPLLALTLVVQVWLLIHLFRQYGRLLVRVDAIQRALENNGILGRGEQTFPAAGLAVGTVAPPFELRQTTGETSSLKHSVEW
jgi:uncharacterized membrane protein YphA (DoxX/SURF4 family)